MRKKEEKKEASAPAEAAKSVAPQFEQYVSAGFPALWVRTHEGTRAVRDYAARLKGIKVGAWDCVSGLTVENKTDPMPDPIGPIMWLTAQEGQAVVFAMNFHRFIGSAEVAQAILNGLDKWKETGKAFIVVSPVVNLPIEVEKAFTILDYGLPDKPTLDRLTRTVADGVQGTSIRVPEGAELDTLLQSALGLTLFEAENALALSIVSQGKFSHEVVAEQKAQLVKKSASMEMSKFSERFSDLGGLDNLKDFALKVAKSPLSKGVLLLGVPGTGKSHFAKALGTELGMPTLCLDMGRLFGSLVGESEERVRNALAVVDAMSPCVLFIDEIEKGLGGIASSAQTDGGTGARVFGTFLQWLNDHQSRVFVVATCNDIMKIPPEFLRAERWDAIFFVDLPTLAERNVILVLYKKLYSVGGEAPDIAGWSGAEIRSLCRIAAMLGVPLKEAAKYIVPLSKSMGQAIDALRQWAKDRTIPASIPEQQGGTGGRMISLAPARKDDENKEVV